MPNPYVIETVYRHVIVPASRRGATVVENIFDEDDNEGAQTA